ncbi:hypothetical protein [Amycolatopsis sp. cmx-11-12]|uniref:hypothetical protein n=1 Tax=Amycolatopsis sp. cmx-11-12 TaxID=2785795 RepID=UPI00391829A4
MPVATRILLTGLVCAAAVGFGGAEASASPREELYQCIIQDNTPLWYNGALLRFTNKGQGLYDILDYGDLRGTVKRSV